MPESGCDGAGYHIEIDRQSASLHQPHHKCQRCNRRHRAEQHRGDACSTHASYWRAITYTFNAGGSAAINTAALIQRLPRLPPSLPISDSTNSTTAGWRISFTAMTGGTSHGIFSTGRSATVTPSVNSAHGAAASLQQLHHADRARSAMRIPNAAESTPSAAAIRNG